VVGNLRETDFGSVALSRNSGTAGRPTHHAYHNYGRNSRAPVHQQQKRRAASQASYRERRAEKLAMLGSNWNRDDGVVWSGWVALKEEAGADS
jgi:hypothetical protein